MPNHEAMRVTRISGIPLNEADKATVLQVKCSIAAFDKFL